MPHRDYVARSKPKRKPKKAKRNFPLFPVVIVAGLLIAFGYGLSVIKGAGDDQPTALEKSLSQPEKTHKPSTTDNKPLPVLEKDEYGFPTDLEKSYATDRLPSGEKIEKREVNPEKQYIMQCGSFRSEQQAKEMEATIAFQGLEAQVRSTRGSKGLWYRVYLGPYQQKRHADVDRHKIEAAGIYSCRIWNWNL